MATFAASTQSAAGGVKWNVHFAAVPQPLLAHPSFAEMSGGSIKLLMALLSAYAGNNNGHLTATLSRLKRYGFNSKDSIAKGLRQLIDFGYIIRTRASVFKDPALYAITWLPINPHPPGKKYDAPVSPGGLSPDLWRHAVALKVAP